MKKEVLGIKIDDISLEEAIQFICHSGKSRMTVFTTGPEFLVTAQSDTEFFKILNLADLNIPDGVGLKFFAGFNNSFAGVDLVLELCKLAVMKKWVIGIVGVREGTEALIRKSLEEKFPGIKVIFDPQKPVDLLFAAFGHPHQEKFLFANKDKFKIGVGVGGSFDFISGVLPRPPKIIRDFGLGWLYRAFTKPGHWKRIWKATVVFPLLLFRSVAMPRL